MTENKNSSVPAALASSVADLVTRMFGGVAGEIGEHLRDKYANWRMGNIEKIAEKTILLLDANSNDSINAVIPPRFAYQFIENASLAEADVLQNAWAGLLAAARTKDNNDESNLIFIHILSQLTSTEALLINNICKDAKTFKISNGLISAITKEEDALLMDINQLQGITEIQDIHHLDRELDHLRSLELIRGGFNPDGNLADVTPTALCLNLYMHCKGYNGSPTDFYKSDDSVINTNQPA